jgi:hypothetical protein
VAYDEPLDNAGMSGRLRHGRHNSDSVTSTSVRGANRAGKGKAKKEKPDTSFLSALECAPLPISCCATFATQCLQVETRLVDLAGTNLPGPCLGRLVPAVVQMQSQATPWHLLLVGAMVLALVLL